MEVAIVIPARLASTRLPRKMLLHETGKPLIQHTYEAAANSRLSAHVLVATDSEEILNAVQAFGGNAVMTSPHHPSGTDRIAEVASQLPRCEFIVNLQGDEPEIDPGVIDQAIHTLRSNGNAQVSTLACPIRDRALLNDPACVKVVMRQDGRALYFSRSPIPFARNWNDALLQTDPPLFWHHLGLYVYRRAMLLEFSTWPCSGLESTEMLEQLRILEAGSEIVVTKVAPQAKGIDTPADYRSFVTRQVNC